MSCPCAYCASGPHTPRKSHVGSVRSAFTERSAQGCLRVTLNSATVLPCKVRVKLNKQHCFLQFQGQPLSIELWTKTLEDELMIEVYHENLLLGEKAIALRACSFTGKEVEMEIPSDFYEERIGVRVVLEYEPHPTGADVFHIYRKTCLSLDDSVFTISGPQGVLTSLQLSDSRGRHRENTWHYVDSFPSNMTLNLQLAVKSIGKSKAIIVKETVALGELKKSVVKYVEIGHEDRRLTLYFAPGVSVMQNTPKNTLRVAVPRDGNDFLRETDLASIEFTLKSPLVTDESLNFKGVSQSDLISAFENDDLTDLFTFEMMTFSPDDKLIVTFRKPEERGTDIYALGLVKLIEIPTLGYDNWCKCPVQCGETLIQLNFFLLKEEFVAAKVSGGTKVRPGEELMYQSKVFFDVLDMMDYKIARIRKKNSILQVQIGKLKARQEMQKRQLFELEHAPARAEFKSLLQRSQKRPPSDSKPPATPDADYKSICICGALNPAYKGYCGKCVAKLKADYERVRGWFEPIDKRFGEYERKLKMWNTRKYALENKLVRLEEKLILPFVVEETEGSVQARELLQELAQLQTDIQMLSEESKTKFEEMDADEEAALGVIQSQEEEIATAASEVEELQHRNEDIKKDIQKTNKQVLEEQQFYEKHSKRAGLK